jgi:DNA-binding transcriptional LysR family regulator
MELRHLRYFVAVAEELNYRRAAARLHIAAPPLSVQIKNLEDEIGAPVFARRGRGIVLTVAGAALLDQARRVLTEADKSIALARRAAKGEIGQITIGHNVPAGFRVFPHVVPAFRKLWPDIHLTFHTLPIPQQLARLKREELDIGFVWLPIGKDGLDVVELLDEKLVAIVPDGHALAPTGRISLKDLSHEPLIIPSREADPILYAELEGAFARAGAVLNVAHELENSLSMLNFAAMGLGCCLLPDYASDVRQVGVVYKALKPPGLSKTLAIVKRQDAGDLAQCFFDFTVETMRRRQRRKRDAP